MSLRALHNRERVAEKIHLYPLLKGDTNFLGIFYVFRKPIKRLL
ncbi:DUF226 domain-containing protein, partial [Borreliella valaisiana]|uniref:Uncharacterized protein n=1 Tax=Borreliella valaisiana VS116 TaxID=445987 RepID=C0R9B6_BORVA|nr:conserved hypothetical protein [Borreliella valaisiana VS116]